MESQTDLQTSYERQIVFHLLIFLKVMEQYRAWGKRALASGVLRGDPQYEPALRQLVEATNLCGQQFQALPEPQKGDREADLLIRNLGQEACVFARCLETLLTTADPAEREALAAELEEKSKGLKQSYRRFGAQYNLAFPGRLDQILEAIRSGAL